MVILTLIGFVFLFLAFLEVVLPQKPSEKFIFINVVLFVLLQILDAHSTWIGIQKFGISVESNEVLRFIFQYSDYKVILVATKVLVIATFITLAAKFKRVSILVAMNLITAFIVGVNYTLYYMTHN